MSNQIGMKTWDTLAEFKADTNITQKKGDEVQIIDTGKPGEQFVGRVPATETADDRYIIAKGGINFWSSAVNKQVGANINMAFAGLISPTEQTINVAVPGTLIGKTYTVAVVSGLSANVQVVEGEVTTDGTLPVRLINQSGVDEPDGTAVINVYEV